MFCSKSCNEKAYKEKLIRGTANEQPMQEVGIGRNQTGSFGHYTTNEKNFDDAGRKKTDRTK